MKYVAIVRRGEHIVAHEADLNLEEVMMYLNGFHNLWEKDHTMNIEIHSHGLD